MKFLIPLLLFSQVAFAAECYVTSVDLLPVAVGDHYELFYVVNSHCYYDDQVIFDGIGQTRFYSIDKLNEEFNPTSADSNEAD